MPRLTDDGACVSLDVHGASISEALSLTRATLQEAARRGRATVRVIHGSSTSVDSPHRRTIKHALAQFFEATPPREAFDWMAGTDTFTITLDLSASRDPRPIRLLDVY